MGILIFLIMVLIIAIFALLFYDESENEKIEQLQKYWNVKIGMTENKMLSIMGGGYSRSLLKNNRTKYEWRINASSYGTFYKGFSTRTYTGVRKVAIYTRNGYVEEIRPYNV